MIDQFVHKLTYSQALVLSMSELSLMRIDLDQRTGEIHEPSRDEIFVRREFGRLPALTQLSALSWIRGQSGPGHQYDRRTK